ncbi:MAG: acetate kinase, partial [Bacilli bacterium]
MAKIIAVNAGSSSLKFQFLDMPSAKVLCSGMIERIGLSESVFSMKVGDEKFKEVLDIKNHDEAVKMLLEALTKYHVVSNLNEIDAVGHRVVHGGEQFSASCIFNDEVAAAIKELSSLAPLHNPANLVGYTSFKEALPSIQHVAVFDTAFHQTMKKGSYLYPIPYEYYTEYGVRKYGFHGTSHLYVSKRMNEILNNKKDSKIITCHLGNGASLAAVKDGKCINTSMGLTPLAGVMMGTRSGDIDPSIITFLMENTNKSAFEIMDILNKESGMLGLSGISADARDVEQAYDKGDERAITTVEVYCNRIADVIGSYVMELGGVDAIVF